MIESRALAVPIDQQASGSTATARAERFEIGPALATWYRPHAHTARLVLTAVLTAIVVLHLVGLLRTYYVDVLYMDAWEMVPLIEKTYQGTASIGDFWAQANEHRPLFPRLVLVPLAHLTHWDTRVEVALNLGLGFLMTLTVGLYLRRSRRLFGPEPFWALPLTALFIFGPGQWENWLWGWEFLIFLQVASGVLGLYLLTTPAAGWGAFAGALALGVVGSYSFGNGLLIWGAGPPLILLGSQPRKYLRLSIFLVVGLATAGLYMHGWQPNPGHPSVAKNFESLAAFRYMARYFAVYLGTAVCNFSEDGAMVAGWTGLALFTGVVGVAIGRRSLRPVLLWPIGLGLYVIGGGLLTSMGRAGFGTRQAMSSHYETISMPLWIGLVLILTVFLRVERESRPGRVGMMRVFLYGAISAIALSSITSASRSEAQWRRWNAEMTPAREALRTNGDGLLQTRLYPNPVLVTERRLILQKHRLSVFRRGAAARPAQ